MTERIHESSGGEGAPPDREVTGEEEFRDSVLGSELPTIVAFTAVWCAPCAWLYPYLDEIAEKGRERVQVRTVDVDRVPSLADRYRIATVPIVLLFESGEERARSVGVEPERLRAMADAAGRASPRTDPAQRN
ncbi:MAG: thioredoxin domain-containing protein [Gemmatimonadota bacterium]